MGYLEPSSERRIDPGYFDNQSDRNGMCLLRSKKVNTSGTYVYKEDEEVQRKKQKRTTSG